VNIFILDLDIEKSVRYHCDKHVVKMITEYAQILSTVCRLEGMDVGYKATHVNHPCVKWAGKTFGNWIYLRKLITALNSEYQYRYETTRNHKAYEVARDLPFPKTLTNPFITAHALAMPDQYKIEGNAVKSYRDYYIGEKRHIANWKRRPIPNWWS